MMNFTETKDYSSTKVKADAKAWTTEKVLEALVELLGAENVGMVRTGSTSSKKNEIGAVIGNVLTADGELPVAVTINISAKPYTDSPASAKRPYKAFDFVEARNDYEAYVDEKLTKEAEKKAAKALKAKND